MDILYLSHCVPNPPDKGDRIRAHHVLRQLVAEYRVHLVAFARSNAELAAARELEGCCASVYVEVLPARVALARAVLHFALGGCLVTSYFATKRMRAYVKALCERVPLGATIAYTTPMAPYAADDLPLMLDMADVDSEKWLHYGRMRRGGPIYTIVGNRLRRQEIRFARRARCTYLTTNAESTLLKSFVPEAATATLENGVDFRYFDATHVVPLPELEHRKFLVFVGVMDYYPNVDAVRWFASEVLPEIRRKDPELEFFIVGRNPSRSVVRLGRQKGVTVTGAVADVRPYMAGSRAVVAPLRLARGIQNKVLEGLAMGKPVMASPEVCETFGASVPSGIVKCRSTKEYLEAYFDTEPIEVDRINLQRRFSWDSNVAVIRTGLRENVCD